jgi:tripeptidyl-peptidase-2
VTEVASELSSFGGRTTLNEAESKKKEDLEARLETLNTMFSKFEEPGATCDCVSWHDGEHWRVAIDINENGDLSGKI